MNFLPVPMILSLFLMPPLDEGRCRWTPGFPMSIPGTGTALVSGQARPEAGFKLVSASVTWFENGCQAKTCNISVGKNGIAEPTFVAGLTPGKRYEVVIIFVQSNGDKQERIASNSHVIAR